MDQELLVNDQLDAGRQLLERLTDSGFTITAAFWARQTNEDGWYLYIASPLVDERGQTATYRIVQDVLRKDPNPWLGPLDVRMISTADPMAKAAAEIIRPKAATGPFAVPNPKPYPGMTRFGGASLGGVNVDGVYIYPPQEVSAA